MTIQTQKTLEAINYRKLRNSQKGTSSPPLDRKIATESVRDILEPEVKTHLGNNAMWKAP